MEYLAPYVAVRTAFYDDYAACAALSSGARDNCRVAAFDKYERDLEATIPPVAAAYKAVKDSITAST